MYFGVGLLGCVPKTVDHGLMYNSTFRGDTPRLHWLSHVKHLAKGVESRVETKRTRRVKLSAR
jgi:hypothetical protein